jgi:hypothetical protein
MKSGPLIFVGLVFVMALVMSLWAATGILYVGDFQSGSQTSELGSDGGLNLGAIVYISGGIVTAISINSTSIASGLTLTSLTPIPLQAGETVTVTYSSAPAMYYKQL